jgi:hypothetical protein
MTSTRPDLHAAPIYDFQPPMSPRREIDPYTMDPRYMQPRPTKKYTATNLGLADPNRGMRPPGPDEGYTSIDRRDHYGGYPYAMGPHEPVYSTKEKSKKDKKDKKGKKDKKPVWEPGDEVPIDYTVGPAMAKNPLFNYR